jgi:hypothetical protein
MTDEMMALRRLMEKSANADLRREMIDFADPRTVIGYIRRANAFKDHPGGWRQLSVSVC